MKKYNKHILRDVTLSLVLKGLLLWAIWWMCFSHPTTEQDIAKQVRNIYTSSYKN